MCVEDPFSQIRSHIGVDFFSEPSAAGMSTVTVASENMDRHYHNIRSSVRHHSLPQS